MIGLIVQQYSKYSKSELPLHMKRGLQKKSGFFQHKGEGGSYAYR